MLYQLTYSSCAIANFNADDLTYLTGQARSNNAQHHITGLLLFYQTYFFQVLEGEEDAILYAYTKIKHDKRHTNLILLDYKEITSRAFAQWHLGLANFPNQLPSLSPKEFFIKNCQLSLHNKDYLEPLIDSFTKGVNYTYLS